MNEKENGNGNGNGNGGEVLRFGVEYRAGNFVVKKMVRTLSKREMKELRDRQGIPSDVRKKLQRSGMPYIRIETVSGNWALEFAYGNAMYHFIDTSVTKDGELDGSVITLFGMMFADTVLLGDAEYFKIKQGAIAGFILRQKAVAGDDREILDELKTEEQAKADLKEMAESIEKGGGDGAQ